MSDTHVDGQRIAVCEDCEMKTRMVPERIKPDTEIACDFCGGRAVLQG